MEVANSDDSSPKELVKEVPDEEKQEPESVPDHEIQMNEEPNSPLVESDPPIKEEPAEEKPQIASKVHPLEETGAQNPVSASEAFPEGEEGWQAVHRPRSAGLHGRRVRQRKSAFNKVYQKKELLHESEEKLKNNFQSGKYHFIKKRANYVDYHTAKAPSSNHKFGRKIVKALTYRVKSVPSAKESTEESGRDESNSSLEVGPVQTSKEVVHVPQRSSRVSIGKSPSYKEVALAPPGSLLQFESHSDIPDDKEIDNGKNEESIKPKETSQEEKVEEFGGSVDNLIDETEDTHLSELIGDEHTETVPENMVEVDTIIDKSVIDIPIPSVTSNLEDLSEMDSATKIKHVDLQEADALNDKSEVTSPNYAQELPNKRLSASATPFNPSLPVRVAPIPINIGPNPWQMNMTLHPRPTNVLPGVNPMCSSPHQPYPTPPGTPNMMHPLPLMYSPPYTQAPSLPISSGPFHPNHFAWQCNMGANGLQYVTGPVWSNCHPMEFSASPPAVRPISDPSMDTKLEHLNGTPNFVTEVNNGDETKLEADLEGSKIISELVGVQSENAGQNWNSESTGDNLVQRPPQKVENEKTFNILIKGRRNRKQTLKLPISLLNKPYNSQSFKVVHSRVIRGGEGPRSSSFSSEGNAAATTTAA